MHRQTDRQKQTDHNNPLLSSSVNKCCLQSACRGQTSKLLANLAGSGHRSEGSSNPQRGLHPPLSGPAKTHKVSHRRKLLCQSPEGQLPTGGITSAYRQKCSQTSKKQNISEFFQQTVFSPKAKQPVETYFGSKQPEFLPQDREIQDGDSGNHQDIPPTRGVGHLHRLQGCILPHPNTGTVQEISEISYPRANIPIQSLAIRTIDSTIGVHCSSKGDETDGHTQGYKDPPVPRRLVSASRIPPSLSPTHSGTGTDVPRVRLVGEFGQVGTGTQTNLRFCRLPVRSESRSCPTDTGPVAEPSGEDLRNSVPTGLSGPAVHVPDWSANGHRKASSPRPTTHETHTVAPQKQLESSRITGKGHSYTQIPSPSFGMVAGQKQCSSRSTMTPVKTCAADLHRRLKRRLGCSLGERTARGS